MWWTFLTNLIMQMWINKIKAFFFIYCLHQIYMLWCKFRSLKAKLVLHSKTWMFFIYIDWNLFCCCCCWTLIHIILSLKYVSSKCFISGFLLDYLAKHTIRLFNNHMGFFWGIVKKIFIYIEKWNFDVEHDFFMWTPTSWYQIIIFLKKN